MATPASLLSVDDFAAKIKAKYPEYQNIDNAVLAQRIVAKYPEYASQVDLGSRAPITTNQGLAGVAQPAPPQFVSRLTGKTASPLEAQGIQNAQTQQPSAPGSFEGHPENIGQYVPATAGRAIEGAVDMSRGNVAMGGRKMIQAGANALAPMAPMAIAGAPVVAAKAAVGGVVGNALAKGGAQMLGATPDQAGLAGDIGGIAGGTLASTVGLPSKAAAGELFSKASAAAGNTPIDLSAPGNRALQIQELAQSGGRMPKVVNDFIRRTTDPNKGALTFDEARQFYSNASRISADEASRLTPVMKYQLSQFTRELGQSISGAAQNAGVGPEYSAAMDQYRKAANIQDVADNIRQAMVKKIIPTGVGLYVLDKILGTKMSQGGH